MSISYTKIGNYELPNLKLEEKGRFNIGKYGLLKLEYLKKNKRGLYIELLMKDKLNKYLHDIDISAWNTSNVTNMQNAFYNCNTFNSNTTLDFSNWVTSKVTNMSGMFYGNISVVSLDLSSFITSEVTNVSAMFRNCTSLSRLDIRNFTFEKCTSTGNMLYGVKTNCLIIVKSQTEKDFILNIRNDLTNVKTVAELETSE